MDKFWTAQRAYTAVGSGTASPMNILKFDQYTSNRYISRPYKMVIRTYYKVNIKYFSTLAYYSITKIDIF